MKILSLAQIDMSRTDACLVHFVDLFNAFKKIEVKGRAIVISSRPSVVKEKGLTVCVLPRCLTYWFIEGIICNIIAWLIILLKARSYDKIYIRHHSNLALAIKFSPWRVPIWLEVNGLFSDESSFRSKTASWQVRLWLGTFLERLTFRKVTHIFCVAPQMRQEIIRRYGINPVKITAISNGVDIEIYRPMDKETCRRQLGLDEDAIYIGFIGNFIGWSGVDTLLKALPPIMKQYEKVRTLIVGDGECFRQYIELANKLGISDKVIFPGRVHKDIAPIWINTFNIGICLTEPKGHGLSPIKLYSYMACGIPVLASDLPGFEPVREYQSGLLAAYKDLSALHSALEKLVSDETLRIKSGQNGRQCAERLFSWQTIAQEMISVA